MISSEAAGLQASARAPARAGALRRLGARLQPVVPGLCAAVTVGGAAWLYAGDDRRGALVGLAQAVPEAVAPVEAGRVGLLHVAVGDRVEAGQLLASLDTALIDADIALARAEVARVEAQGRTEEALIEQRLDLDRESLERERARHRQELRKASAEQQALDGQIVRVKRLVDEHQAVQGDLARLDLQRATAAAVAAEKPRELGLLARQIDAAEARHGRLSGALSVVASRQAADLEVARRSLERLERRRAACELRASRAGRVSSLNRQPGEAVGAGEPVVTLVSPRARVLACLPERAAGGAQPGDAAALWPRGRGGEPLAGQVLSLGPAVVELPARCWLSPGVPVWGREVLIGLDASVELVPGQAFDVRILPPPGGGLPPAAPPLPAVPAASSPTASLAPRPLVVPAGLAQRTRFEPSGLLALPGKGRFFVVSDDTGRPPDDEKPWIFAMSTGGVVEPSPPMRARANGTARWRTRWSHEEPAALRVGASMRPRRVPRMS